MRSRSSIVLRLVFALASVLASEARAGGFGENEHFENNDPFAELVLPRLPISSATARTWVALHETRIKPLPDKTPLGQIIQAVKEATRGVDGKAPPVEFVIDATALTASEITMQTPVPLPIIGREEVTADVYLTLVLKPWPLSHRVHSGVVLIEDPCDDCPGYQRVTGPEARTWLLLNEIVPLKYAEGVPLGTLLERIHQATASKGKNGHGLIIHVGTPREEEAKTMQTKISIDLERAPLCTALKLALKQADLGFFVRDDGVVTIRSSDDIDAEMDESDLIEGYRFERYGHFHEARNRFMMKLEQLSPGPAQPKNQAGAPSGGGMKSIRPARRTETRGTADAVPQTDYLAPIHARGQAASGDTPGRRSSPK